MSIFSELLPKLNAISNTFTQNYIDNLKVAFECFDKFEDEYKNGRGRAREKALKDKNHMTTLQSINEDDDETNKKSVTVISSDKSNNESVRQSTSEISNDEQKTVSKKRSKNEMDGLSSPEQDKRLKRNASAKAESIISKQVNVLMMIDDSIEKDQSKNSKKKDAENTEENKENTEPPVQIKQEKMSIPPEPMDMESLPLINVKQEVDKDEIAMPPPMAPVPKPRKGALAKEKSEESRNEDSSRSRRSSRRRKQPEDVPAVASTRSTRASSRATKPPEEELPPPPPAETRTKRTRAKKKVSEMASTDNEKESMQSGVDNATASPNEKSRPKRTRRGKATEKESIQQEQIPEPVPSENGLTSHSPILKHGEKTKSNLMEAALKSKIADKSNEVHTIENSNTQLDKTRIINRVSLNENIDMEKTVVLSNGVYNHSKNAAKVSEMASTDNEKESMQSGVDNATASPNEKSRPKRAKRGKATEKESIQQEEIPKPVPPKNGLISLPDVTHSPILKPKEKTKSILIEEVLKSKIADKSNKVHTIENSNTQLDKTRIINRVSLNENTDMDKTVVLSNGVYNHSKNAACIMNETVVLETCNRETMVIGKQHVIMDTTVVLERDPRVMTMLTDDNSIMTDDNDDQHTPPKSEPPKIQPTSAVKEKVQQFEEMASRVTRTKTRAMKKQEEEHTENQTPPEKISKPVLSAETLNKMNNMIFNGKPPQISRSTSKPRVNTATLLKSHISASTSKLNAINKAREAAEEILKREKEDARKKKEAILEAKREQQKRKREEKMAAAAAAREAAEKERRAAMEAAARDRIEKQAHVDQGKAERLKEAERKKQESARKIAEMEERRKAEEKARQQRLAEEQRRADAARRKQQEEAEAMRKEEAKMSKEIEKRQKEYIEKQKLKTKLEMDKFHTPFKMPGTPGGGNAIEPVYMADGFQYLNSDSDREEPAERPIPMWSSSKARRAFLAVQALVSSSYIDELFGVRAQTPDLRQIFPNIERARLKRTSSAVWRTPPSLRAVPE